MSKGKYSPVCPTRSDDYEFRFNAKGEIPAIRNPGDSYDEETMFDNYDEDGFDSYGYSAYDRNGRFVGCGQGVDPNGYTASDYYGMTDEEFADMY